MNDLEKDLTNIYSSLCLKAQILMNNLNSRIYKSNIGLYCSSLMQYEDEEESDISYPIPIIEINKLCNIEYWLDKVIITCRININDISNIDLDKVNMYNWELYGCREYPYLFHNKNDCKDKFNNKLNELKQLDEKEIGIQIYFNIDEDNEIIINCINKIRNLNMFYIK